MMKTKEEIQESTKGTVYTMDEFSALCCEGLFDPYDRKQGFVHDGETETDIDVWTLEEPMYILKASYPYVVWYNKPQEDRG